MNIRRLIRLCETLGGGPAHEHDCDECVFVGSDVSQPGEPNTNQVDMYVHPQGNARMTLIRRYGSDESAYSSAPYPGPLSARYGPVLDAGRAAGVIS